MEIFGNELDKINAGHPQQGFIEQIALNNESLYSKSSIDSLKNDMQNFNGRSK